MNQQLDAIGKIAGEVWQYLKQNGTTSLTELEKEVDAPKLQTHLAIGWLAREGKLNLTQEKKTTRIWLIE
jgi:hypothetical protein